MPEPRWLPRHWRRLLVLIVLAGLAVHVLLPQVGQLHQSVHALTNAHPWWLAASAVAVAASFPASALSVIGAAGQRLSLRRTTAVELAASFLNRLTPGGIGRAGLLGRYLDRCHVPRAAVAGVVAVNLAAGAVVHVLALVAVIVFARPRAAHTPKLPDRFSDLLGVLAVLVAVGIAVTVILLRRRWAGIRARLVPLREQLRTVFTRPSYLGALLGGVALVNLLMVWALLASLNAFGARASFAVVALVYLGGSAVASVAPTPGGLGAMEAALVAGLTGFGVAAGPAVTAVLAFRLISWWAPAGIGAAAWAALHRTHVL